MVILVSNKDADCISAYVELPANIVTPPAPGAAATTTPALTTTPVQAERKKKYQLSSSTDPLFGELRDVNFAVLGSLLSTIARRLSSDYEVRSFRLNAEIMRFILFSEST